MVECGAPFASYTRRATRQQTEYKAIIIHVKFLSRRSQVENPMNECGVVNTDYYGTENRRIEEKCTKAGLGIIIDIVDWSSPGQQALAASLRITCQIVDNSRPRTTLSVRIGTTFTS